MEAMLRMAELEMKKMQAMLPAYCYVTFVSFL